MLLAYIHQNSHFKLNIYGHSVRENCLQLENFEKQHKVPFVVYATLNAIVQNWNMKKLLI